MYFEVQHDAPIFLTDTYVFLQILETNSTICNECIKENVTIQIILTNIPSVMGAYELKFLWAFVPLKKQYAGFSPFKKAVCRLCSFPHVNAGFALLLNMDQ